MDRDENIPVDKDSEMLKQAVGVSRIIRKVFHDNSLSTEIFDICDKENWQGFCIRFIAFQYFVIVFRRERGSIGCYIEQGQSQIPLQIGEHSYSEDLEKYFKLVSKELKLRIPDKYQKEHGWD